MGIQEVFTCTRTCDYNWAKGDLSKALFCQVTQKWAGGQKVDLSEEKLWEQAGSKYGKEKKLGCKSPGSKRVQVIQKAAGEFQV